jgi:hypothetical protein
MLIRQGGRSGDAVSEYFRKSRGQLLTAANVMDHFGCSKDTALSRLKAAQEWEITQPAAGRHPAVWEYAGTGLYDPFASGAEPF